MKAILLAGGTGSRMRPTTSAINKHLLPVYNKPMIFYSLSVLLLLKFREIIIICEPSSIDLYKKLLSNGSNLGIKIKYVIQRKANGIAESFLIAQKLIKNENVCLMLADNFIFGSDVFNTLKGGLQNISGAHFYAYSVQNSKNYAVLNSKNNKIIDIEEKPKNPKSNLAIPGLYFFDKDVVTHCKSLKKSKRGELEIVDLINIYVKNKKAKFSIIGRGICWLDMGSFDDLNDCSNFIRAIEKRQHFVIGSPEEIAWRNKFISLKKLKKIANKYKNEYGKYLSNLSK
jgi:glucose-1-phosphate thymidylyltransferase